LGRVLSLALLIALSACSLEERTDFLIGRTCDPNAPSSCDPGEACLPHAIDIHGFEDFRCRDRASFQPINDQDPPLAYCDNAKYQCPPGTVCNADRIRNLDGGLRPLVCQLPNGTLGPPLDGSVDPG
jgi:hypothetical protein